MSDFGIPWREWEPVYEAILADFGFDREADETARDELARSLGDSGGTSEILPEAAGRQVAIAGGARTLETELDTVRGADLVVGVSTATALLAEHEIAIDVHVTDLDKDAETVVSLTAGEIPVVLHAHGDNRDALAALVPRCDRSAIVPTTQAKPTERVRNPGGFTDGDRAAFLADALGAESLTFPGWEFDDRTVGPVKSRKLAWAERLLHWLEIRRGERFDILEGRRASLSLPPGAPVGED